MIPVHKQNINYEVIDFCEKFKHSKQPKLIFGINEFANSIAEAMDIDGFIDDYTTTTVHLGKPIYKTETIPKNALVVNVVILGRPLTAKNKLNEQGIEHLDYFAFYKYSRLKLPNVTFWDGFIQDFETNRSKYEWVYSILSDEQSKQEFEKIINFRLSYDLANMHGFKNIQDQQYFDAILNIATCDVFVDIGGFDGFTSREFIKRNPHYKHIYFFEPDITNMEIAKELLKDFSGIQYYEMGLSNAKGNTNFCINGSSSKIDSSGTKIIYVDRLDNIIFEPIQYIKMDVEGYESSVLEGCEKIIKDYQPSLAVCTYHKPDDLWKIPEQVLSINKSYKVYLRHYTEGITETVLYFLPD